jgi:hypothetical protein
MCPAEQELMLKCHDGINQLSPLIFYLWQNFKRSAQIFDWLVRRGYTGNELLIFWKHEHAGSLLEVARTALAALDGEARAEKIIKAGKDFGRPPGGV